MAESSDGSPVTPAGGTPVSNRKQSKSYSSLAISFAKEYGVELGTGSKFTESGRVYDALVAVKENGFFWFDLDPDDFSRKRQKKRGSNRQWTVQDFVGR